MAEIVKVEVHGLRELGSDAARLADQIEEEAPREFLGVADKVASRVRQSVPRRTGALAGSVSAQGIGEGASVGIGGPEVPYAGWVEFGGTRGRPYVEQGRYLYPAALGADSQLEAAGYAVAEDQIGRFRWENPSR